MKVEGDRITFRSGRTMYANNGIVGICPDLEIFEGYDGAAYIKGSGYTGQFATADAVELADHMIERWQQFKQRVET